jgi:hypothetical protein
MEAPAPAPLEITFHGPFVFRFGLEYAYAYAPKCDEHYLNILTDTEDVELPMNNNNPIRTFTFSGPNPTPPVLTTTPTPTLKPSVIPQQGNPCSIVHYDWQREVWPDSEKEWQHVLRFPLPDYYFGLIPEYMWIYGYPNPKNVTEGPYARALRFRYNDSPKSPNFDQFTTYPINATHLSCPTSIPACSRDPFYSIEIRYGHYASVAKKKAEYYLDAQSCFESMREKLPPCDTWKAFFGRDPSRPYPTFPVGTSGTPAGSYLSTFSGGGPNGPHDCGASVMVMNDQK